MSEIRSGSDTGTLIGAAVHDADGHMTKLCENGTVTKSATDCSATGTGSTTLALVWNALDHLATATRTGIGAIAESYQYDDSGRRIQKTSGATTTSYLYDGDAIHAEWNGGISGNPAAVYVHGAGIDDPILRLTGATSGPGATQASYIQDGLGTVVGTTNTTGTLTANQRFDAWGVKTASSGTIPQYGYTGREPDATGLSFYRARYYHPGLGRFASRDPMGMVDAVSGYAYVANNPVNLVDPTGLYAAPSSAIAFGTGGAGGKGGPSSTLGNLTFQDYSAPTQQGLGPFASGGQGVQVANAALAVCGVWPIGTAVCAGTTLAAGWGIYNSSQNNNGGSAGGRNDLSGGSGGGMDPCSGFGIGCQNQGNSQPGNWVSTNESMSNRAAQYQEQISGRPYNQSYQVNGVKFDGYNGQSLIDAKGPGYANLLSPQNASWSRAANGLIQQARDQVGAAQGTPIQWHVAEPEAAAAIRGLLSRENITGIRVINTPPKVP